MTKTFYLARPKPGDANTTYYGDLPRDPFDSYVDAEQAARDLAAAHPGHVFYVLAAVCSFRVERPVSRRKLLHVEEVHGG